MGLVEDLIEQGTLGSGVEGPITRSDQPTPPQTDTEFSFPDLPRNPGESESDYMSRYQLFKQGQNAGGSAPSFASTEAGLRLQAQLQADAALKDEHFRTLFQNAGFDYDTLLQDDRFDFQRVESALDRTFRLDEAEADRVFTTGRDEASAALQRELQNAGFGADEARQLAGFTFSNEQRVANETFQSAESELNRSLQKEMQSADISARAELEASRQEFQAGESAADRAFTAGENAAQRALQERLQAQGFDQQTAERIASQTFSAKESERDRVFQQAMQGEGFDFQTSERIASQVFNSEQRELDRENTRVLQEDAQEFERENLEKELGVRRNQQIVDAMASGKPIKAILLGLGIGGGVFPQGKEFEGLGAVEGAQEQAEQAQMAIEGLAGQEAGTVKIGEKGVTGFGGEADLLKQARRFQSGATAQAEKTLLTDVFSVGGTTSKGKETAGFGGKDIARLVQQVTPTGALNR